jgi:hypothetical protein
MLQAGELLPTGRKRYCSCRDQSRVSNRANDLGESVVAAASTSRLGSRAVNAYSIRGAGRRPRCHPRPIGGLRAGGCCGIITPLGRPQALSDGCHLCAKPAAQSRRAGTGTVQGARWKLRSWSYDGRWGHLRTDTRRADLAGSRGRVPDLGDRTAGDRRETCAPHTETVSSITHAESGYTLNSRSAAQLAPRRTRCTTAHRARRAP